MFKKVFCLFLLEVFFIIGFNYEEVTCFASTDFLDVPSSHVYYEDIAYMKDSGYVGGYGDNTFRPEQNIKLIEVATILNNIKGDNKVGPLPNCFINGWIPMGIASKSPLTELSRGEIYDILFNFFNINVCYLDSNQSLYDSYLQNVISFGLCDSNAKISDFVTRGEFSYLINSFMNNKYNVLVPDWLNNFPITSSTNENLSIYYRNLNKVPDVILEKFIEQEWILDVSKKEVGRLNNDSNLIAVGWTHYIEKAIYVSAPGPIVHEFGHFLENLLLFPLEHIDLYNKEGLVFSEKFLNKYNLDKLEYFATYFDKYIASKDNVKLMEELKIYTPSTYTYFVGLEENNWGIE